MELLDRLAPLKLMVFDVDGILTDGGLWIDDSGSTCKRFDIRDGAGVKYAQRAGYTVAFLSGHESGATRARAAGLGVEICYCGIKEKVPAFEEMLQRLQLAPEEALYMADDLMDLPVLRRAGFAVTVPDGHEEVKRVCHYVTAAPAGRGAVREAIEVVLKATGRFQHILERYL